jgi:hypothetical protein
MSHLLSLSVERNRLSSLVNINRLTNLHTLLVARNRIQSIGIEKRRSVPFLFLTVVNFLFYESGFVIVFPSLAYS